MSLFTDPLADPQQCGTCREMGINTVAMNNCVVCEHTVCPRCADVQIMVASTSVPIGPRRSNPNSPWIRTPSRRREQIWHAMCIDCSEHHNRAPLTHIVMDYFKLASAVILSAAKIINRYRDNSDILDDIEHDLAHADHWNTDNHIGEIIYYPNTAETGGTFNTD